MNQTSNFNNLKKDILSALDRRNQSDRDSKTTRIVIRVINLVLIFLATIIILGDISGNLVKNFDAYVSPCMYFISFTLLRFAFIEKQKECPYLFSSYDECVWIRVYTSMTYIIIYRSNSRE